MPEGLDAFKGDAKKEEKIDLTKKVKIGIIGTGWIAGNHMEEYLKMPDVEVVAAADLIPGKAEAFMEKFGVTGVRFYPNDRALIEQILESEIVIFSFPLYSYGMPGALKNVIDRMMPLSSWNMVRDEKGKYGHRMQVDVSRLRHIMMICGCGFPNSRHNFEGAVRQFELKFPGSTIVTVPESPMFNIPQAAPFVAPRLAALKKAGAEFAAAGALCPETLAEICSPMIPEEIYAQFANGERT